MDRPVSTHNECVTVRGDDGRFLPGTIPPGRPKGRVGGRAAALQTLDAMLGEARNQENLRHALQASFDNDPVKFFKQIIMPLLPTEVKMKLGADRGRGFAGRSLFEISHNSKPALAKAGFARMSLPID
jgi:hypothetical protein